MTRGGILLSFLLSWAAWLAGEVAWTRLCALTLGSSLRSQALVLAASLGGLALGNALGGRLAVRFRPLFLYGLLLLGAGLASALVLPLLALAEVVLGPLYRLNDGSPSHLLFAAPKALLTLAAILPPALLQGAMFPVLVRRLTGSGGEAGAWAGVLGTLSSLGAAAGAWGAGFILIPLLGVSRSLHLAAGVNVALGLWTLLCARRPVPAAGAAAPSAAAAAVAVAPPLEAAASEPHPPFRRPGVYLAFLTAGLAGALLEVGWMRAAVLTLGGSTYSFSLIAGLVAGGLAAGSLIGAIFADRLRSPQSALGWSLAAAALTALAATPALGVLPVEFSHWLARARFTVSFPIFLLAGAVWTGALLLPAALFLGLVFPVAGRIFGGSREELAPAVGSALAAHAGGSVLGALLAAYVLLPATGRSWSPLYAGAALALAAGLVLVLRDPARPRRRPVRIAFTALAASVFVAFAFWNRPHGVFDSEGKRRFWSPLTLSLGPLLQYQVAGRAETAGEIEAVYRNSFETVYYKDGAEASVGVFRGKGTEIQALRVDGEIEASTGPESMDMPVQLLAGHLPLLARPEARSALVLGLGSGVTLGALASHPEIEPLDCLEVSPEVVEAARAFSASNRGVLDDRRLRLIVGDGRGHLRFTASRYDVISSHPSGFWGAGRGGLFSRETYEAMERALAPGGVACQCFVASRVRAEDFRIALRSFAAAFASVSLWSSGQHVFLLGSRQPVEWRRSWIAGRLERSGAAADFALLGIDRPESLFRHLRLEDAGTRKLAGSGPENLDRVPRLEFGAPFGLFEAETANAAGLLITSEGAASPAGVGLRLEGFAEGARAEAEGFRRRGLLLQALDAQLGGRQLPAALESLYRIRGERDRWLSEGSAHLLSRYGQALAPSRRGEWRLFLYRALLLDDRPTLRAAYQELGPGKVDARLLKAAAKEAAALDWTAHLLLAQEALDREDFPAALSALEEAARRGAPAHRLGQMRGYAHAYQGDLEAAESQFREALAAAPEGERGEILYNLGHSREVRKDYAGAAEFQRKALAEGADKGRSGAALARCLRAQGLYLEAFAAAEEASKAKGSAEAHYEAALAQLQMGNRAEALHYLVLAAALDPGKYKKELEALERAR